MNSISWLDHHAVDAAARNTALAVKPQTRRRSAPQPLHRPAAGRVIILAKELHGFYFTKKMGRHIRDHGGELGKVPSWKASATRADPVGEAGRHAFRVIVGDYVTTSDGTGIVHIAPTFGADDDRVARPPASAALHGRPRGQEPADGRQAGQILFDRRPRPGNS